MRPFKGKCHTCGHDHDAENERTMAALGSIRIPTETMEHEFSAHHRRGYEAGKREAESAEVLRLRAIIAAEADQLQRWAHESQRGGWSTHQVKPMLARAAKLRRLLTPQDAPANYVPMPGAGLGLCEDGT